MIQMIKIIESGRTEVALSAPERCMNFKKIPKIYSVKGGESDLTKADLLALKNASVTDCDNSGLVELRGVRIDKSKPVSKRMEEYLSAVGNPYLFRVGDVTVKVSFNPQGKRFAEALADVLAAS